MRSGGWLAIVATFGMFLAGSGMSLADSSASLSNDGADASSATGGNVIVEDLLVPTPEPGVLLTGLLGYVEGSAPTRLVVMAHGYEHNVQDSWTQHVLRTTRADTAVVTTNYRDNLMFPILKGAQDTIQATLIALERFPTVNDVYLLGISMGGTISGTAITESIGMGGPGKSLYDHWIAVEPAAMPAETWAEASAIGHPAAAQIAHDAGGTPLEVPDAYVRRSPTLRTDEMAAGGLQNAVVVHAFHDGLVPYDQGRGLATALLGAEIPVSMFNIGRDARGQTSGTTLTKDVHDVTGLPDVNEETLDLAGHGSEADPNHPVIRTGFEQLEAMLDGTFTVVPYSEHLVDDQL